MKGKILMGRIIEAATAKTVSIREGLIDAMQIGCSRLRCSLTRLVREEKGQGTTEYAILVGVLVVIACLAIAVFKPKIQELWDAISSGINSL